MNLYKLAVAIFSVAYAMFIFSYPASYFNDDSLFFAKGIVNFSVVDFSPHFPGYPFVILFGKIVNFFIDDNKYSLFIVTAFSAVLIPIVLFIYVEKIIDSKGAFVVFLLTITSVYMHNLSLSMLSDSVGLLFFFLAMYFLELNKQKESGLLFGISFLSRPSYFVFFIGGLVYLCLYKRDRLKTTIIYFLAVVGSFLVFICIHSGVLYFDEALRFIGGHFSLWGRGEGLEITWIDNIIVYENLIYLTLFIVFKFDKKFILLYMLFISYFFWVIFAQNPENIRHIIPLFFILNIFMYALKDRQILLVVILLFNTYNISKHKAFISPTDQIANEILDVNEVIISNRSIEILREIYGYKVADAYYKDSTEYIKHSQKSYIITGQKPKEGNYKIYEGRFVGERNLYLLSNKI